ncbi:hypothetical protein [Haloterrigena alkaliphila]|uniref:Small CPxCG-related zinc finger protein n=1 Tax=Haloterrigena alkaliphila TaxID=2816475 RepID=A0A8A2VBV9_9EURY|nr:hypothetical protein [Haloterrigena alkaliphila]QSW98981.1 hypothetical protein J0X25_16600 [Haloterrigena alkaliphila]
MTDETAGPAARPTCPDCDAPVLTVTVVGPTDGFVAPCGCRIAPLALEAPLE